MREVKRFEFRVKREHPIDGGRLVHICAMLSNGLVEVEWYTDCGTARTWVRKSLIECVEIVEDPLESGIFKEREYASQT